MGLFYLIKNESLIIGQRRGAYDCLKTEFKESLKKEKNNIDKLSIRLYYQYMNRYSYIQIKEENK